jgi:hypothetical protein
MLCAIMLRVVMLNVVAPFCHHVIIWENGRMCFELK